MDNLSDINFKISEHTIFHYNIRSLNLYIDELLVYLNTISHKYI